MVRISKLEVEGEEGAAAMVQHQPVSLSLREQHHWCLNHGKIGLPHEFLAFLGPYRN